MDDNLFGNLVYDYGWVGRYSYKLFDDLVNVKLVVPCDAGEEIEASQREAFSAFNSKRDSLIAQAEEAIFAYYQKVVEDYRDRLGDEYADRMAPKIRQLSELASLIEPTDIVIQQSFGSSDRIVGLLFSCSWDPELGLAVKFLNESVGEVGPQDIVL